MDDKSKAAPIAQPPTQVSVGPTAAKMSTGGGFFVEPTNFTELWQMANIVAGSGAVRADYTNKPAAVLVAWQHGKELGLSPMQALQSIYVVNGVPTVFGDAGIAICMRSPDWVDYKIDFDPATFTATATVWRKNREPKVAIFTKEMAEKAKLWGKAGPWTTYPERQCGWRAITWALRAQFPDAMRGIHVYEEEVDIDREPVHVREQLEPGASRADSLAARLEAADASKAAEVTQALPCCDGVPPYHTKECETAEAMAQRAEAEKQALELQHQAERATTPGMKAAQETLLP